MQRAVERERLPPKVDRVGDFAGLFPLLAFRMRDDVELRPGECPDLAFAQPVPSFLVHHGANRLRIATRRNAVHGDLCDGVLPGEGLAAGFVIDVKSKTGQFPRLHAVRFEQMHHTGDCRDHRPENEDNDPRTLVPRVPEKAQVIPPAGQQRDAAGRTSPEGKFSHHGFGKVGRHGWSGQLAIREIMQESSRSSVRTGSGLANCMNAEPQSDTRSVSPQKSGAACCDRTR